MSDFTLDPGAVSQTEDVLDQTGRRVLHEAEAAAIEITNLSGSGWSGAAFNAAANRQLGPFADEAKRLFDEIDRLRENLGLSRQRVQAEEDSNEQSFQGTGNFDRLSA